MDVLAQLLEELASGRLKIVDLTTPLSPETAVIDLPPMVRALAKSDPDGDLPLR